MTVESRLRRRGIALLEVLVSLAIIGLGVTATLKVIGICTRSESRATKQLVAAELAAHQLAILRAQSPSAAGGQHRGAFGSPHEGYSWEVTIEPPAGDVPLRLVRLSIYTESAPNEALLVTQSLL